ncbi:MAG: M20/M25/M40 family metallo-hydrolase [Vicinamibacteria bacterium]|jgi:carboxypeptidase Q|nr:M20/M25/M40 family metallo-hydrolase [Vicinamibacteria bacterium]
MSTKHFLVKAVAVGALVVFGSSLSAQERIDYEAIAKIRREGRTNSQIMKTLHVLTDVHGPRLTGSPNYKAAAEWVVKQTTAWGFENARLEPWDFGHPGWSNDRFSGFIVAPVKDSLVGEVLAWTPGTKGAARGKAVRIEPPSCAPAPRGAAAPPAAVAGPGARPTIVCPTLDELNTALEAVKAKIKGAIVLVGAATKVPVTLTPGSTRADDEEMRRRFDLDNPAPSPFGNAAPTPSPDPTRLTANKIAEIVDQFLVANGALVRLNDAGREHGQIRAFNNRTFDIAKAVPTVVLRNEDYGRISRLIDGGASVELEFDIVNQSYPEGKTSYNVVAEIPGTDKKAEVVMLGGHLDSWHSATGATDNAIGSAVMMEAARIIKAAGLKPRRTIRLALWGGEEQGLLGSKAYVKEHFGTFENPKSEFAGFNGYFNVDSGTGRIRGANIFGPKEAGAILRDVLAPFEDFGLMGASVTASRRSGGTDSTTFNEAGLPGIGLGQDPIQYGTHTWHTNLDTYERIVEDDVIKSAIAIAGAVYHVANRDEMLPRFPKDKMPAPPPAPTPTP